MKKKATSWLFLIVVLALVLVPTARAEWWDRYHVNIKSVTKSQLTLTYGWSCPWACNHYGSEPGYLLFIGHGSTKSECWDNADDNQVAHMVSSPYVYQWPLDVSQELEPGDVTCIWWCCQPVAPLMCFKWDYMVLAHRVFLPLVAK